ncbi:forkhead box protein J1-like, partial [Mesoplodon densirostris]|uniref:forkhead box protein J1-like n=1 Tax=Mesoplodon densirostris TaxID=48708 RepID=UPI0028DB6F0D
MALAALLCSVLESQGAQSRACQGDRQSTPVLGRGALENRVTPASSPDCNFAGLATTAEEQDAEDFSFLNAEVPALPSADTDPHGYHELSGSAEPGSPLAADQPHTPGKPTSLCTPRSAIYKWITDSFCYFRHADPTWQNSIRHNLSLKKGFIKMPREKDEPGKGGFWRIDPQYAERLLSGALKKRRLPPVHIHPAFARQAAPEPSAAPWAGPLTVSTEAQQLLREFEEATGEAGWGAGEGRLGRKRQQPLPKQEAKVPRPSSPLLLTPEEQGELEPLKGNFDWEAILDAGTLDGELGTLETSELIPPLSPASHGDVDLTIHGHHIDCPVTWGPPVEQATDSLDFDETLLATSFLEHPWDESTRSSLPPEPLFEAGDATLASDLHDWA